MSGEGQKRRLVRLPRVERLEIAIVVELYDIIAKDERYYATHAEVIDRLKLDIGLGLIGSLFARVINDSEFVRVFNDGDIGLTDVGIDFIQHGIVSPDTPINQYLEFGTDWLLDVERPSDTVYNTKDVVDEWRPLPIDRTDPATENLIEKMETAMIAVRQDNGYSESHPEERDYVVQNLGTAIEWFRTEKTILLLKTRTWILDPLDQAAKRFGPSVVGAAVTMARELFVAWLKKKLIGG